MQIIDSVTRELTQIYRQAPWAQRIVADADFYIQQAEKLFYLRFPQVQVMNNFEKFLFLNIALIIFFIIFRLIPYFNPFRIYKKIVGIVFSLPMVKNKVNAELEVVKKQFLDSYPEKFRSKRKTIPYNPEEPEVGNESELESLKGHLSGSRYPEKKHSDFVANLAKDFSYSNPLHFDLHPFVKQMEVEVIRMCAKMLNFYGEKQGEHPEVVGGFFSGGTESILMAILAYREYGYKYRGITNPNLIVCETAHAAALKAADMFQIQVRYVGTDSQERMSVSGTKKLIDSNTICVYTSYPNYPYGTVDPVDQIAALCKKKNVPVHIDMCLGGFLVPFLKDSEGKPMFTVPKGATSISLDCHKYGLSGKGASILLFSSEKIRRQQVFVTGEWPGGLYGTVGISGSRSGTYIASAWISMMKMGIKGYTKNAESVQKATVTLASELKKLGFKVFGKPEICCIGFSHPNISIDLIKQKMKKKGWDIPLIQRPIAFHYSFTPLNSAHIDQMVNDFKSVMEQISKLKKEERQAKKSSDAELYGACAKIPDGPTRCLIFQHVLDLFLEI